MSDTIQISNIPISKGGINQTFESLKSVIVEGLVDPLKVKREIKAMETFIKQFNDDDDIKDAVMREADKYSAKSFDAFGAKFTLSSRTEYDYSVDRSWSDLNMQLQAVKAAMKSREELLKSGVKVDMTTGEELPVLPKRTTDIISVSLK